MMSAFTSKDFEFMAEAIRLARRGMYSCRPNPRVGCVLVRDNEIVGTGWHRLAGEAHAEINALRDAASLAVGASAYVTLEPCSHYGRTPPCAAALVDAGIVSVTAASEDPNPKVSGSGFALLRQAGVSVRIGLMQKAAAGLNEGFFSRVTRGRPFVRVKIAASLDGRTAMSGGESQWITGVDARADAHQLRAASGAILTGVETILADDPSLTARYAAPEGAEAQPLRVILDSNLRTPPDARLFSSAGAVCVLCVDAARKAPLEQAGAEVISVKPAAGRPDLNEVLTLLAKRKINDVLVEAGPTLSGQFLSQGLLDELVIYQAPQILGSETRGMFMTPDWTRLDQRQALTVIDVRQVGADARITARPGSAGALA